jgi:hypothetical protein
VSIPSPATRAEAEGEGVPPSYSRYGHSVYTIPIY